MEKPLTYSKEPWLFKLQSLACGELWNSICPEDRFFNAHEKKGELKIAFLYNLCGTILRAALSRNWYIIVSIPWAELKHAHPANP